jgi:general secretion pathway protein G
MIVALCAYFSVRKFEQQFGPVNRNIRQSPPDSVISHRLSQARTFLAPWNGISGYTLIELMVVICIIGTLAAIAVPSFMGYVDKARVLRTIAEIRTIEKEIITYQIAHDALPADLSAVGYGSLLDPWGTPYQYLRIETSSQDEDTGNGTGAGKDLGSLMGKVRKNRFMVPINTDYDLYSRGKDRQSVSPLTAQHSRDDIIRANNGGFVGLASNF